MRLHALAAHDAARAGVRDVDVVVINSVLQCFTGHNYLRGVLRTAVDLLGEHGLIFLGNVFDQDLKDAFLDELRAFQKAHGALGFRTKTDYSEELFLNRAFLDDLCHDFPEIAAIDCSPLLGTHESELSTYSFDALIRIDKTRTRTRTQTTRRRQHRRGRGTRHSSIGVPCRPSHANRSPNRLARKRWPT